MVSKHEILLVGQLTNSMSVPKIYVFCVVLSLGNCVKGQTHLCVVLSLGNCFDRQTHVMCIFVSSSLVWPRGV